MIVISSDGVRSSRRARIAAISPGFESCARTTTNSAASENTALNSVGSSAGSPSIGSRWTNPPNAGAPIHAESSGRPSMTGVSGAAGVATARSVKRRIAVPADACCATDAAGVPRMAIKGKMRDGRMAVGFGYPNLAPNSLMSRFCQDFSRHYIDNFLTTNVV